MKILGINISHDPSIASVVDGKPEFVFDEPRFRRDKWWTPSPEDYEYESIHQKVNPDEYDEIIERGNDINSGVIYFFLKNKKIRGACGLGIVGKVGRDIRITSKLTEKNTIVDKQILSDQNLKLNKLIQKQ